ncbi:uncharacterized protein PRCAT00001499001 [Priceomyces carsonii]|uniref:uncharacterized protein n=1 Tax=Priceomyces carsonii TaxID=28549 RepID=UPI002ED9A9C7|nr:unnamed protein product [Priceomyces carsonii]
MSKKDNDSREEEDREDKVYNQYAKNSDIPDERVIESIFEERKTEHADDAIDYEDIDELADESDDSAGAINQNVGRDSDFEEMFGEVDNDLSNLGTGMDDDNHITLNELGSSHGLVDDDGLNSLDMGEMFHDEYSHFSNGKRAKVLSEGEREQKRQKLKALVEKMEEKKKNRTIAYYYPDFSVNKPFNFHLHLLPAPKYYKPIPPPISLKDNIKPLIPTKISLEVDLDERKLFRSKKALVNKPIFAPESRLNRIIDISPLAVSFIEGLESNADHLKPLTKPIDFIERDAASDNIFSDFSKDLILSTADWDDDQIINAGDESFPQKKVDVEVSKLDDDYEEDEGIFNGNINEKNFSLDMNDPSLIFIPEKRSNKSKALIPTTDKLLEQKFNISNDSYYEILKTNYNTKVRSQLSNLNIEHSIPALRLQAPYYKVKLNKTESRAFHRPNFVVRPGTLMSFSKVKLRKKKNDRGKSPQETFRKTSDLSFADSGPIVGMEYCEEYPQILSNFGMCSKLINYYRKEKEDDSSRPKAQLGETHVLGLQDRSPFWNFGEVAPGDFIPTLYNNMIRSPVFKHDVKETDFLLIRSQGAGSHQRYFLRNINHIFAVGDLFPAVEVPAPHSRKVTNTSKNRLKMVVFRAMNNNKESRISVKDISHHFPDQNDMQNRQRLKEFMEYQRQGDDQGYWKIKNTDIVPLEDDIRNMITPEDVCILDSMQYGQQCLEDTNIVFGDNPVDDVMKKEKKAKKEESQDLEDTDKENEKEVDKEKEKTKEKEKQKRSRDTEVTDMDIEEEIAPWNMTRNFITANQSKAMLQLNGEGDPSGIGLGYSFLRATQKNNFKPLFPPPKEHVPKNSTAAYQQKLYDAEIKRIWYSQRRSLVDHGPDFDLNAIYEEYKPMNQYKFMKEKLKEESKNDSPRVLRISRRFRDENNVLQRRVETISDPRLIKAYLKRKKQIEDDLIRNAEVDDIIPTDDKELNKIRRKALEEKLASLEKRAKQNRGRKPSKDVLHAATAAGGVVIDANTVMLPDGSYAFGGKGIGKGKSKTRRCASCGAFGHIRTKKTCPLYYQTNGGTIPVSKLDNTIPIPELITLNSGSPVSRQSPTEFSKQPSSDGLHT